MRKAGKDLIVALEIALIVARRMEFVTKLLTNVTVILVIQGLTVL